MRLGGRYPQTMCLVLHRPSMLARWRAYSAYVMHVMHAIYDENGPCVYLLRNRKVPMDTGLARIGLVGWLLLSHSAEQFLNASNEHRKLMSIGAAGSVEPDILELHALLS